MRARALRLRLVPRSRSARCQDPSRGRRDARDAPAQAAAEDAETYPARVARTELPTRCPPQCGPTGPDPEPGAHRPRGMSRRFYRIAKPCAHNCIRGTQGWTRQTVAAGARLDFVSSASEAMSALAPPSSEGATANHRMPAAPAPPSIAMPDADSTGLRRNFAGAMASAATNLCPALSLGILAFAPLGPAYYHIGVYAGFASAIWGHLAAGLFGGAAHPGSGPRAAPTLIFASLVAVLAADPALA